MLNYLNKRIFILCPANFATGGPMLLHQLGFHLLQRGYQVQMYYFNATADEHPVHTNYASYQVPYVTTIEDSEDHFLIIPETELEYTYVYKKTQKAIWWLSVDNYLFKLEAERKKPFSFKRLLGIKKSFAQVKLSNPQLIHWCQSYYALDFVKTKGILKASMLSDYIDQLFIDEVIDNKTIKQNWIAYNPKKGFEFTEQLIQSMPHLEWKPIINMTPAEVKQLLLNCKVYIDFGKHPGKDRIPREAALCGCCVVTNKEGSAKFDEDVPIAQAYKFDTQKPNWLIEVGACINACLNTYQSKQSDFDSYREFILQEEKMFNWQLDAIFPIKNN